MLAGPQRIEPAGLGVLDAPALREAEVAALADDPAAQLRAVDAHRVIRAVADLGVLADIVEARFPKAAAFEYKILDSRDAPIGGQFREKTREALDKYLAALGREGWEIVGLQITEHGDRLSFVGLAKRAAV